MIKHHKGSMVDNRSPGISSRAPLFKIKKPSTNFDNHRHMMDYATYLEKGYPISTGVVEGTCGSLVKDRNGAIQDALVY